MSQLNNFIDYGIPIFALVVFVYLGVKYFSYWKQLREAFVKAGMQWPLLSQKELSETAQRDLSKSYQIMGSGIGEAARILFSMQTDDPIISKPLRGMRRTLIAFILFPILLVIILVAILAFLNIQ
jgi:hypothetical protein